MGYKDSLESIKESILSLNGYFNNAYVVLGKDDIALPNDTKGDYFYIRLDPTAIWDSQGRSRIRATLVAFVRNADPFKLLDNLEQSVKRICDYETSVVSATWHSNTVIRTEMGVAEIGTQTTRETLINSALKNFPKNAALVSITFDYISVYQKKDAGCITPPCIDC